MDHDFKLDLKLLGQPVVLGFLGVTNGTRADPLDFKVLQMVSEFKKFVTTPTTLIENGIYEFIIKGSNSGLPKTWF